MQPKGLSDFRIVVSESLSFLGIIGKMKESLEGGLQNVGFERD